MRNENIFLKLKDEEPLPHFATAMERVESAEDEIVHEDVGSHPVTPVSAMKSYYSSQSAFRLPFEVKVALVEDIDEALMVSGVDLPSFTPIT